MKGFFKVAFTIIALVGGNSFVAFASDTEKQDGKMEIEKIIENCEKMYTAETYPDDQERQNYIEQCIDENSSNLPLPTDNDSPG